MCLNSRYACKIVTCNVNVNVARGTKDHGKATVRSLC